MDHSLPHALIVREHYRALLQQQFPDIDDEALRDTLEGISDLPEMVATVLRSHLDDLTLASALRSRTPDIQERLSRIEGRAEKKRTLVASVMERADLRKLTEPEFMLSLRPATYWKPQPPKLDRAALVAALKAGEYVPGASLGNGGVTRVVRTR